MSDGAAVVAGCAHEENARSFIDFMLSPQVQQMLEEDFSRRGVCGAGEGTEGLRLIDYDIQWASGRQQSLLALWE